MTRSVLVNYCPFFGRMIYRVVGGLLVVYLVNVVVVLKPQYRATDIISIHISLYTVRGDVSHSDV